MSEPILIALVQLFAFVAASKHRISSDNTRFIIETYLKQYLNNKELKEYLLLYDELFLFHQMIMDSPKKKDESQVDRVKSLCGRINKGLQLKDKLIILVRFIEFTETINSTLEQKDKKEHEQDLALYEVIKSTFNISERDYKTLLTFATEPAKLAKSHKHYLLIADELKNEKVKTIIRNRLVVNIHIIFLKSVDLFIGRYQGQEEIYLNGHYVPSGQSFLLNVGSILKSERMKPVYYADIVSELLSVEHDVSLQYAVKDISYKFKNSNNGVKPFSLSLDSGELVGVMGASGAGKSTLLNLLNGSIKPGTGSIYINGEELSSNNDDLDGIIGFIPQDDLLIEELTVFQNLYFNARLCFSQFTRYRLTRLILTILADVDLLSIRDLVVGSPLNKVISGGQRKRLNIALELIREPYIMFADEPTSGLSSMDSEMVMALLKEQTLNGRIVMVNIHQPSTNIFKLFDKLLLLDKGGYPIFYGNPIDSITYFKSASKHVNPTDSECLSCGYVNPEQLFQLIQSKTINKHGLITNQRTSSPEHWYSLFKRTLQPTLEPDIKSSTLPESNFKIPAQGRQFRIFNLRNWVVKLTNKQYMLINLLEAPFLAFILAYLTRYSSNTGYVFGENKNLVAFMFMSIVVSLFLGMMVSAEEIIKDRKILKREAFLNLSWFSYLNAKVVFLIIVSAIQSLLYVAVGSLILEIHGMFFTWWLILFSTSSFANLVGLNISSALNTVVNIYIIIPFILVPQLLLSGVIVPFDALNTKVKSKQEVPVVGDLMASRWAFEALAVSQFKHNKHQKEFFYVQQQLAANSYRLSYLIPAVQSKLEEVSFNLANNNNRDDISKTIRILQKEVHKLYSDAGVAMHDSTPLPSEVSLQGYKRESNLFGLIDLRSYLSARQRECFNKKDAINKQLIAEYTQEGLLQMKHKYENTKLSELLRNRSAINHIRYDEFGFVQVKNPIYKLPESTWGRAHFYAPVKIIGSYKMDTLIFNLLAIWFMTLVLYLALWQRSLRKIMDYFSQQFLRRK